MIFDSISTLHRRITVFGFVKLARYNNVNHMQNRHFIETIRNVSTNRYEINILNASVYVDILKGDRNLMINVCMIKFHILPMHSRRSRHAGACTGKNIMLPRTRLSAQLSLARGMCRCMRKFKVSAAEKRLCTYNSHTYITHYRYICAHTQLTHKLLQPLLVNSPVCVSLWLCLPRTAR